MSNTAFEKRYVLLEPLGAGGMGEVYRAHDRLTKETVALKRMRLFDRNTDKSEDDLTNLRTALAQEFQILASLRHSNIITVLDYGFDADRKPYFTMTLLKSLRTIVEAAANQTIATKIELLVQVLRALAYLHRRGIVHRDLKPSNILVTDGQVKVLDFGLAINSEHARGRVGTIAYMAPEVIRGAGSTERTDLFSLGVIAFELFSGRRPFSGKTAPEIMRAILYVPPDLSKMFINNPETPDGPNVPTLRVDAPTIAVSDYFSADDISEGFDIERVADGESEGSKEVRIATVVGKLLQKEASDRYADAVTVIHDFSETIGHPLPIETTSSRESFLQAARFVGRTPERAQLENSVVDALAGCGSGWLIGGESGVGKSRLLDEIRIQALVKGAWVLRGQALKEGGAPYQLWRDSLRWLSLMTELTELEAGVLKALVPDIADLLGRDVPNPPVIDADATVNRLLNAIDSIFRKQKHPIVLILEDLHWADEDLLVLKRLIRNVQSLPLMVIASYRDDERPELAFQIPGMQLISLQRFEETSIAELSESMLGPEGRQPHVVEFLQRQTEGNAFFLVEVVRVLAEEAGRLDQIGVMALPHSVVSGGIQRIVERRLDRIPINARPLLELAAVIGRQIDLNILRKQNPVELESWLIACAGAAVVEVRENQWRFSHDRIREGLLGSIDAQRRRNLHGVAAVAMEAVYENDPQYAVALAYHFAAAGDYPREAHYSALAGDYAFRAGAYTDAIKLLRRAVEIHERDPNPPFSVAVLERTLGEAFFGIGPSESRVHLERALKLLGHPMPSTPLGLMFSATKSIAEQLIHAALPQAIMERLYDEKRRGLWIETSRTLERLGHAYYHLGDAHRSVVAALMNVNVVERAGLSPELARTYGQQIVAAGMIPIHSLANRFWRKARAAAERVNQPAALAWVWLVASVYFGGVGRWSESDELLKAANREHERLGNRRRWEEGSVILAVALMLQGKLHEALRLFNDVHPAAVAGDDVEAQGFAKLGQAMVAELRCELDQAVHAIEDARQLLHGKGPSNEAWVYGVASRLHARRGEFGLAEENAGKGLERIATLQPLGFYMLEGYAGVAETYLVLLRDSEVISPQRRQEFQTSARKAIRSFNKFAGVFPVAKPRALLLQGRTFLLAGRPKQAEKILRDALDTAKHFQMPYEQGLIHYELARSVPNAASQEHLLRASDIFEHLGIPVKFSWGERVADPQRYV